MSTPRKALVLAAGFGTRLRPLTWRTPKPLLPIWGVPLLARTLRRLESWGVEEIFINTHWRQKTIEAYLAKQTFNARVTAVYEPEILGTGGALRPLKEHLGKKPFWLVNGDIVFSLDPAPLLEKFGAQPCAACVWLHSAPARGENRTLSFKIALSPLAPCENFPDGFLEGLRRTLVAGTLATLMAEEGKPYAKPSGVAANLYAWDKGVYECNARRHTGDTTAPISALNTSWLPEF